MSRTSLLLLVVARVTCRLSVFESPNRTRYSKKLRQTTWASRLPPTYFDEPTQYAPSTDRAVKARFGCHLRVLRRSVVC
ncbi:hypothetical protein F5X68DRAFT_213038 [Plectosphaerella plurivora]|uniref:Secreted protein n=1 Tax=Plectosphaerella plurivora TaxID=936078 RepID=A0A9P9A9N5_9PEZI|nr:hypothetical protein F5X68DRAFT_213038 [Plectosphaerella plurivora]